MKPIIVELQQDEAILFRLFQQKHDIVAPIVGYLDTLGLVNLANSQITLDLDHTGVIKHMSITKHYRQ